MRQATAPAPARAPAAQADGRAARRATFTEFNRSAKRLIQALRADLPHVQELAWLRAALKMCKTLSVSMPHRYWDSEFAVPHGAAIAAHDEGYFYTPAFVVQSVPGLVDAARREWPALSVASRAAVWAHMGELLALGARCRAYSGSDPGCGV